MEPNTPAGGPSPEAGPSLPNVESAPTQTESGGVETAPKPAAPEGERANRESANQNQGMVLPAPVLQPAAPAPAAQTKDDSSDDQATALDSPELANDVDVIEKEWVDKAKQIVKETVDDPHKQNHNVSVLKADYMKKRYGKDIKIPDENPAKA